MDANLIVLLIILGAGLAVLMGYGATHVLFRASPGKSDVEGLVASADELTQLQYMRQVRLRNLDVLAASVRSPR